jgi:hypothetical protein
MNASLKTIVLSEGIALLSKVQNLPSSELKGSIELEQWLDWQVKVNNPRWTRFVERQQYHLFDLINADTELGTSRYFA